MRPATSLVSTLPPAAVIAVIAVVALAGTGWAQKPDYTPGATRMAWYARHVESTRISPFRGVRWQFLGPKNLSGRVTDVAVGQPSGRVFTIYVAGASGGVWKTENAGNDWKPVFEHGASTSIGDVTLAPSNEEIVWIGTGESNIFRSSMAGCGVYKSTDGGRSFQHMGLPGTHTIARIVIHPQDPDTVYVAASGHEWTDNPERGVYKSTNGGKSWEKVLFVDAKTGAIDLVMQPDTPDTLYAATWQRVRKRWNDPRNEGDYTGSGIFKTTDGGKSWTPINKGLPEARWRGRIGIDLCRSRPNVVYAFVDNYESSGARPPRRDAYGRAAVRPIKGAEIYRSDDGGHEWTKTSPSNRFMARHSGTYGWVFGQVRVDPTDPDVIYTMGIGLHVSRDAGKTFKTLRGPHVDHHALWIDPDNPKFLVNGNDGGANMSFDGGRKWIYFTEDLPMVQFFNVNYDMARPFHVYGSIQDHGSRRGIVDISRSRRRIPAQDFEWAPGGEGSHHFADPRDPNTVYSCGFYGQITRTDMLRGRKGSSKLELRAPADEGPLRGQWLAHFILSPHDPDVLYHGMNYLFRSRNKGKDMEVISPDLTHDDKATMGDVPFHTITAVAESPLERGVLFVGTDDGRVWASKDDGGTWQEIVDGIARHRWVSRLEASRFAKGRVYMAQNGKRHDDFTPYLWKSSDYGKTWQSIVANIPIGPINVVREDPKDEKILYVGTDLGVYVSIDGGIVWNALPHRLPTTFVSDLVVHPRDDIIVISTHGRGMYAMDGKALRRAIARFKRGGDK